MPQHRIVGHDQWVSARKELLARGKELTRARDALSAARRDLPWEEVTKPYAFTSENGKETLADLFDGRSQLIVYHFMFDPDWDAGCKSCSFMADHFDPAIVHLAQRDVTMVAVSRAPLEKLLAFRKRMGWSFNWLSSFGGDFNHDYHVTFSEDEIANGSAYYNYASGGFPVAEAPGISVFYKDDAGNIFHTYSVYARGLDIFLNAYNYLDIAPKGRNEDGLPYSMDWLRLHDSY
jgi:predicted dithiol-disulfide oxidoreductase (DUF899 family)